MNFVENKARASRVTFTRDTFSVHLVDGRVLVVPLAYFPRLLQAKVSERKQYTLSGGGSGIHWDELDEDVSVQGLLAGRGDQTAAATQTHSKDLETA